MKDADPALFAVRFTEKEDPVHKSLQHLRYCGILYCVIVFFPLNGEQAGGLGSEVKSVTGAP